MIETRKLVPRGKRPRPTIAEWHMPEMDALLDGAREAATAQVTSALTQIIEASRKAVEAAVAEALVYCAQHEADASIDAQRRELIVRLPLGDEYAEPQWKMSLDTFFDEEVDCGSDEGLHDLREMLRKYLAQVETAIARRGNSGPTD